MQLGLFNITSKFHVTSVIHKEFLVTNSSHLLLAVRLYRSLILSSFSSEAVHSCIPTLNVIHINTAATNTFTLIPIRNKIYICSILAVISHNLTWDEKAKFNLQLILTQPHDNEGWHPFPRTSLTCSLVLKLSFGSHKANDVIGRSGRMWRKGALWWPGWKTCTHSLLRSYMSSPTRTSENFLHNSNHFPAVLIYSFCFNKSPYGTNFSLVNFFKSDVLFDIYCNLSFRFHLIQTVLL